MKLNVIGRQMNVYEETKQQIAKKLAKLDKFFPGEGEATVALSRKHGASRVEITINASVLCTAASRTPTISARLLTVA